MGNNKSKDVEIRVLTENEIESILENTEYTRKEINEFYENFTKVYPTGFLYKNEFTKLYKELYPHKKCDDFLDQIFSMFDSDKSGFVSFGEFMIAVSLSGRKEPEEKLRLIFRMFDHNRNGFIDKKELDTILKSVSDVSDEISIGDVMGWDKDNSGHLAEGEFVKFIMENPKLKHYFINLIRVHD